MPELHGKRTPDQSVGSSEQVPTVYGQRFATASTHVQGADVGIPSFRFC
jgi:hypothetical protein